jgi:quinoprotein relay system zinc metallohydrolase 2
MTPTRRAVLAGGLCLCCLPARGRAEHGVVEVASGVFVRRGPDEEATDANLGGIANVGFIVGEDAVLVADPGGSLADGRWLRAEIRRRTDRPIRHVVVSHVHPDHGFGAAAFDEDRPNVVGHWRLAGALAARGEFYRRRLVELLGEADAGWPVPPTQEVGEAGAEIDLGGRVVRLTAHGIAHTDCDLSMLDTATGMLLPADLLFVGRVPALDGSLSGWLAECARLRATGAARAVPGHGPAVVELAPALAELERYLGVLRDETRAVIARNEPIEAAAEVVAQSERGRWTLFRDYNGRNVIQAYKELEWE